jgi:hypothetical protein
VIHPTGEQALIWTLMAAMCATRVMHVVCHEAIHLVYVVTRYVAAADGAEGSNSRLIRPSSSPLASHLPEVDETFQTAPTCYMVAGTHIHASL